MTLIPMTLFVLFIAALAVHSIYRAKKLNSLKKKRPIMEENSNVNLIDVIKIFSELEKKAKETNPELLHLIESYNSNQAGLDMLHGYQSTISQSSSVTSNSNKI